MFAKLSLAVALVPFVSALTLNTPTGLSSTGQATITWTSTSTDSPFSLELVNTLFHNSFAIANNLQPGTGSATFYLPEVPVGDGYTIEAVNVTDINDVYATSGDFAISAASSTTASSSTAASSGASSSGSVSATTTGSSAISSSTSPSSTSSSPTTSASNFSGAMAKFSLGSTGSYATMLLATVAGAVVVAL